MISSVRLFSDDAYISDHEILGGGEGAQQSISMNSSTTVECVSMPTNITFQHNNKNKIVQFQMDILKQPRTTGHTNTTHQSVKHKFLYKWLSCRIPLSTQRIT